jgi:Flp pilus assembly protein TadG
MALRDRWRQQTDREAGSVTVFVIGMSLILVAMAGLVVDGGLALNARQRVNDDVEQAARAGSLNIDMAQLRNNGVVRIDPGPASDAAAAFLAARHYPGGQVVITADPGQITVTAELIQKTSLLSLIGVKSFTVRASGQAQPSVGVDQGTTP